MTSKPIGPESKRSQEAAQQTAAAAPKAADSKTSSAAASGLGAGVPRGQALSLTVQHVAGGEVKKLQERIATMPFCQAVRELREVMQSDFIAAAGLRKDAPKGREALKQLEELYLRRIAEQYNRAANLCEAEMLAAGSVPTLMQAEALVAELQGTPQMRPLHELLDYGLDAKSGEILKDLIELGVDVNGRNSDGTTALMLTAQRGMVDRARQLLAVPGVDVNAQNSRGRTALMDAAYVGKVEVVRLLLTAPGIDITITDHDGHTAMDLAKGTGEREIAALLRDAAAGGAAGAGGGAGAAGAGSG